MVQTIDKTGITLSPQPLYQLATGFAITKTLLVAHRLGLFEAIGTMFKTAQEVSAQAKLPIRTTEMLLDACVSLKICSKEGDRYTNGLLVQRYLLASQPGYLGRFFDHFNDHMYPAWQYLEDAVRTGHAQIQRVVGKEKDHFFQAMDRNKDHLETFMATMDEHSLLEGEALASAYDFSSHRELLDVGGGTGAMSVAILRRYPHLRATVFDRPPVCEIAQRVIREQGMADRISTRAGDFFVDALPAAADITLLSGILHNWSPSKVRVILRQCAKALPSGKTLLISEQILSDTKTEPLAAVMASLNMLVMMDEGQEYSRSEFETFLSETGFRLEEVRPTGAVRQLLVVRRC
jgi:precorrin-6B methylase 2